MYFSLIIIPCHNGQNGNQDDEWVSALIGTMFVLGYNENAICPSKEGLLALIDNWKCRPVGDPVPFFPNPADTELLSHEK